MSTALRRLVSAGIVAVLVAVGAGLYFTSRGSSNQSSQQPTYQPGPAPVINEDTAQLRRLKAKAGIETCRPGRAHSALPAVTFPCLGGGRSVDLSRLKGPMLLSFWQAGCTFCRQEMPALQSFSEQYGHHVPILGVDILDQYPASALAMMHRYGARYPSIADPDGDLLKQAQFAKVRNGLPQLYFIDADGQVVYATTGAVTSEGELIGLVRQHLGVDL